MGVLVAVGQWTPVARGTRRAVARASELEAVPKLEPGERVLVREQTAQRLPCLGTTHALWLRDTTPFAQPWRAMRWTEVERVRWSRSTGRLTLTVTEQRRPVSVDLVPASRIPALAEERVSAATIAVRTVPIPSGGTLTVRVIQRADRSVRWQVRLSPDADPDDPFVPVAVAELRAQFGC